MGQVCGNMVNPTPEEKAPQEKGKMGEDRAVEYLKFLKKFEVIKDYKYVARRPYEGDISVWLKDVENDESSVIVEVKHYPKTKIVPPHIRWKFYRDVLINEHYCGGVLIMIQSQWDCNCKRKLKMEGVKIEEGILYDVVDHDTMDKKPITYISVEQGKESSASDTIEKSDLNKFAEAIKRVYKCAKDKTDAEGGIFNSISLNGYKEKAYEDDSLGEDGKTFR